MFDLNENEIRQIDEVVDSCTIENTEISLKSDVYTCGGSNCTGKCGGTCQAACRTYFC